jgi:hypothetical protein
VLTWVFFLGTGRSIAIADDQARCLPALANFIQPNFHFLQFDTALPGMSLLPHTDPTKPPPPSFVFGHLCRLVQLRGKLGDVLNNIVKRKSQVHGGAVDPALSYVLSLAKDELTLIRMNFLSDLQFQLTSFYQSLPPSLVFTIQNFRLYSTHNQAAIFLLLHVMFHSVITLLHRPALLQSFTPDVDLPLLTSVDLSRSVRSLPLLNSWLM